MARSIETWTKKGAIGLKVLHREGPRRGAIKWAKEKYGYSKRYIQECIAIAKRLEKLELGKLDREGKPLEFYLSPTEISQIQDIIRRPGFKRMAGPAASFLIRTLIGGPRRAIEVMATAKVDGIPLRTLQRAVKLTGFVKISRVGGRNGHWSWELSERAKNIFGTEV
jgi:hypothetical protein